MFKNGLLPIELPSAEFEELDHLLPASNTKHAIVNLERCTITVDGAEIGFEVSAARRLALLEGLEDFDVVQRSIGEIDAYEKRDRVPRPWNLAVAS